MTQPHMEYHYSTNFRGHVCVNYGQWPVGTTFEAVKAEIYPTDDSFQAVKVHWPSYAWPGAYEMHYIVADGGVLCHGCANQEMPRTLDADDHQFHIIGQDTNWEDPEMYCDHCNRQIKPEYGDD